MKTRHVGVSPLTRYVVKVSGMYFRFGFPEELPINSGMRERERERERERGGGIVFEKSYTAPHLYSSS